MKRAALGLLVLVWASAECGASSYIDVYETSARQVALGGIFALAGPGPFATHTNPADLSGPARSAVGLSWGRPHPFIDDAWIGHGGLSFAQGPFGVGIVFTHLDFGDLPGTDEQGNPLSGTYRTQSFQLGLAVDLTSAFGMRASDRPLEWKVGANGKRIDSQIRIDETQGESVENNADAMTFDFGVSGSLRLMRGDATGRPELRLRLAGVLDGLSEESLRFDSGNGDPLYRFRRVGAALEGKLLPDPRFGHLLNFALLVEYAEQDHRRVITEQHIVAMELMLAQLASIRIGQQRELDGPSVGVGLALSAVGLPVGLGLDFSSQINSAFEGGEVFLVSLSFHRKLEQRFPNGDSE